MPPTLKTISERVGISQAAVSMILNRRANDLSSEATRQKVFEIARELNYKQQFAHKILRGEKTRSVAIVFAMRRLILEEQIQQLVLLLLNKFENAGFTPCLMNIAGNAEENLNTIRELCQRGIDHFVSIGCPHGFSEIEKEIIARNRTIVGYNSLFSRDWSNDTAYAIRTTVAAFLAEGRRNFRVLTGKIPHKSRIQAVHDVLPELSQDEIIRKYIYCNTEVGEVDDIDELSAIGYQCTRDILTKDPGVSAIIYVSDYHMMGGVRYLYENNFTIGKDVKLCGINDIHAVRNSVFSLNTWRINIEKISSILVEECDKEGEIRALIKPEFHSINALG